MFSKEEQLLNPILDFYINQPIESILSGEMETKSILRKTEIKIVVNQKAAPYFSAHIENENIQAKFLIENCTLIEGEVSPDDQKRIKAFYVDPKSQVVLKKVWLNVT